MLVAVNKFDLIWFDLIQTLLKITHPASRKSYLVIICRQSHGEFTKIEIN